VRWQRAGRAMRLGASRGHNNRVLAASRALAAGTYRLTISPVGRGKPQSLVFQVR